MNKKDIGTLVPNINDFSQDYNECKGCTKGVAFCKRPCWPTPQEVKNLMDSGYGDRLMLDMWGRSKEDGGHIFIIAPATPGKESTFAPDVEILSMDEEQLAKADPMKMMEFMLKEIGSLATGTMGVRNGCNFQSADGLCQLHDIGLKPFEGRRTCCKVPAKEIHQAVAWSWDTEEGREIVKQWKEKYFKEEVL